jgi:MSHA biogenesis protein MshM
MPYLAHFGLEEHPFTLTPDVDYFFPTQEHANIIGSVEFALRRDTGIIKVVGAVGTGKTLLCRLLIKKLVDSEAVAYINAPRANANSIILAMCREFGIDVGDDADAAYHSLNGFLVEEHAKNRLAILVVDEAQHLGKEGLELVRLVSNLETEKRKLLQIVLFGQTELDELLADPSLRQLTQRIAFSLETKPLTVEESKRYINHRLRVSRRQGVEYDVFSPRAVDLLARACGGIPRVLNIVADKSLLAAFATGSAVVQPAHVAEAIKESPALVRPVAAGHGPVRRLLGRVAAYFGGLVAVAVVAAAVVAALPGGRAGQHVRAALHALSGNAGGASDPATASPKVSETAAVTAPAPHNAPTQAAAQLDRPQRSGDVSAKPQAEQPQVAATEPAREAAAPVPAPANNEPQKEVAAPAPEPPAPAASNAPASADDSVKQLAAAAEMPKPPPPAHRVRHRAKSAAATKAKKTTDLATTAATGTAPPPDTANPAATVSSAVVQSPADTPSAASPVTAVAADKSGSAAPAAHSDH